MRISGSSLDTCARSDQDCYNSIISKPHHVIGPTLKTQNLVHLLLGRWIQPITCHQPAEDSRDLALKCRPGSHRVLICLALPV